MVELKDLGRTIRQARRQSGISQLELARMTALSRATVNYVERGHVSIGADALLRIMEPLGISISTPNSSSWTSAVTLLAASASVSFRETIPPQVLEHALLTGGVEDRWLPHIAHVVDEASDAMLLRAVREVAMSHDVSPTEVWRHLKLMAESLASPHLRWHRV